MVLAFYPHDYAKLSINSYQPAIARISHSESREVNMS